MLVCLVNERIDTAAEVNSHTLSPQLWSMTARLKGTDSTTQHTHKRHTCNQHCLKGEKASEHCLRRLMIHSLLLSGRAAQHDTALELHKLA